MEILGSTILQLAFYLPDDLPVLLGMWDSYKLKTKNLQEFANKLLQIVPEVSRFPFFCSSLLGSEWQLLYINLVMIITFVLTANTFEEPFCCSVLKAFGNEAYTLLDWGNLL